MVCVALPTEDAGLIFGDILRNYFNAVMVGVSGSCYLVFGSPKEHKVVCLSDTIH